MPKLCMTRTINLSTTQFRYQIVFFIHIHDWLRVAFWHLFPRQTCCQHLLTGGMILLIQRQFFTGGNLLLEQVTVQ